MLDLQAELTKRTWRWFQVRIAGLPTGSVWSYALYPQDPATGDRARSRVESVVTLDDPDDVDAFFARMAG